MEMRIKLELEMRLGLRKYGTFGMNGVWSTPIIWEAYFDYYFENRTEMALFHSG